jgi:subtilase family serine protease
VGSRTVPELAGGASSTATTAVMIPSSTATGTWFIIAQADAENAVTEISETNNTAAGATRIGPDLLVTGLSAPATITAGVPIAIADVTANQGGGAAGPSTTRYFLSSDYSYSGSDVQLGARDVPSLAAGANSSGSATVTVPAGTAPGKYYLIAVSDSGATVPETVETNNTRLFAVSVVAGT